MHTAFETYKLHDEAALVLKEIGHKFNRFLEDLEQYVPEGRERAILITKLEEASFFAAKGFALNSDNQE